MRARRPWRSALNSRHVRFDDGEPGGSGPASSRGAARGKPEGSGPGPSGGAAGSDDGSVEWAAAQAAAEPLTTRFSFQPHALKRGKSRARLERYRIVTTLLELQRLNPTKSLDRANDTAKSRLALYMGDYRGRAW